MRVRHVNTTALAVAVLLAAAGAVVLSLGGRSATTQSDKDPVPSVTPSPLVGTAAAEAEGLTLVTDNVVVGCNDFIELDKATEGEGGYCLDELGLSPAAAWGLAERIKGHVPSAEEAQLWTEQRQWEEQQILSGDWPPKTPPPGWPPSPTAEASPAGA
jgi:hypothetical protein